MSESPSALSVEFLALFNGKETISGRAQGYLDAVTFLEAGNAHRKMFACLVFYEKPIQFLATGKTRSVVGPNGATIAPKGDGKAVDSSLIKFLPVHTNQMLEEIKDRKPEKFGAFINVNFTMVRRVALLAMQKEWLKGEASKQWQQAYGGKPFEIDFKAPKWTKMSEESYEIKKEGIVAFNGDRDHWKELVFVP